MKCKICGSENIVKEDSHFTCQSCGSVFYSAPDDDAPEVIKEAKEAIEAEEEAKAARKAEEEEQARLAEQARKEKEAQLAEEILKNSEKRAASHGVIEDMEDVKEVKDLGEIPSAEGATQVLEHLGDELKAPDETRVLDKIEDIKPSIEPKAEKEDLEATKAIPQPFYVPEKMADIPVEEYERLEAEKEAEENGEIEPEEVAQAAEETEAEETEEVVEEVAEEAEEEAEEKEDKKEKKSKKNKEEKPVKKKSALREILDFCLPIIIALVIALALKTFVFANAKVPTGSMLNTIHEGDRVIASRIEYNFHEPERGDIIIFKFPDDVAKHEKDPSQKVQYFVKRVIGLPGETVTVVNGVVYITDKDGKSTQLEEDYIQACTPTGNYGPYKVPKDSYFVMGDNRESSVDSRFWTTTNYVDKDLIIGKVKFRYYPSVGKVE